MAQVETPAVDLVGEQDDQDVAADAHAISLRASIGLSDELDLELSMDGAMQIVPVPLGGSIGGRYQLLRGTQLHVSVAGRLGGLAVGLPNRDNPDDTCDGPCAYALYGQASVVAQYQRLGWLKPLVALTVTPARVFNQGLAMAPNSFSATAGSATVGFALSLGDVEITPFVNAVSFRSSALGQPGTLVGGGVAFALRGAGAPAPFSP